MAFAGIKKGVIYLSVILMAAVLSGCNFLSSNSDSDDLLLFMAAEELFGEGNTYVLTKEETRYTKENRLLMECYHSYDSDLNEIQEETIIYYRMINAPDIPFYPYDERVETHKNITVTEKEYSKGMLIKATAMSYYDEEDSENIISTTIETTSYNGNDTISRFEVTIDYTAVETPDFHGILDYIYIFDDVKATNIYVELDSDNDVYEGLISNTYDENGSIVREDFTLYNVEHSNTYEYYENGNIKKATREFDIESLLSPLDVVHFYPTGVTTYTYENGKLFKKEIDLECDNETDYIVYSRYDDNGNLAREEFDYTMEGDGVDLVTTYTWELR